MGRILRKNISILITLVAIPLLLLAFNNCSQSTESDVSSSVYESATLNGNGDGYTGKASYVSYATSGECDAFGTDKKSIVEIIDNKPMLIQENCRPITPKAAPDFNVKPHNPIHGLIGEQLFEIYDPNEFTEILCRSDNINFNFGRREIADVYILLINGKYYGNIKMGYYENGILVKEKQALNIEMSKNSPGDSNLIGYNSLNSSLEDKFHLGVNLETLIGEVHALPKDVTAPPSEVTGDSAMVIHQLKCYYHGQK